MMQMNMSLTKRLHHAKKSEKHNLEDKDFDPIGDIALSDQPTSKSSHAFVRGRFVKHMKKRQKKIHHCAEIVLKTKDEDKALVPLRGLLDTSTSEITSLLNLLKRAAISVSKASQSSGKLWGQCS